MVAQSIGGLPASQSQGSLEQMWKTPEVETTAKQVTSRSGRRRKLLWLGVAVFVVLAAVGITVGVLASKGVIATRSSNTDSDAAADAEPPETSVQDDDKDSNNDDETQITTTATTESSSTTSTKTSTSTKHSSTASACPSKDDIPKKSRGTDLDTSQWLDMTDFNCTFTSTTVGDLPLVGLNTTWSDKARANPNVPALSQPWGDYAARPARGVNVGGWLSLEPFITPSMFEYPDSAGVVDEWTLCKHLGDKAAKVLEKHYSTFVTEEDFKAIADAGLDHVRIPFSYWAVETYDDDTYVPRISWRYLLRGIEWARKYGLRIKLDLHGVPGSQNGWNHSGRSGKPDWIAGKNGAQNAERTLEIHDRLSKFFAQDRYKNVIAFYGLVNEPARSLDTDKVKDWTEKAVNIVVKNKVHGVPVFSEGLLGLDAWKGAFPDLQKDHLVVDAHQYTIFDPYLLSFEPKDRVEYACNKFAKQNTDSMSQYGPTMVAEWSQAHTDCVQHLNGFNTGNRWTGTFPDVPGPSCPTKNDQCDCTVSNDEGLFTDAYKTFIKTFAMAQMDAFEKGWGWFYWTWKTESAPLWSYKAGVEGGFMPKKAYEREWHCEMDVPDLSGVKDYQ
ncbi:glycoside hydrolase [Sarocladium strictum]